MQASNSGLQISFQVEQDLIGFHDRYYAKDPSAEKST